MVEGDLVQALGSFTVQTTSGPLQVKRGDLFRSDDPLVKKHRPAFGAPTVRDSTALFPGYTALAVETATAAPGEHRSPVMAGTARAARAKARTTDDGEV